VQATPFESSGKLIQGVECVLFKADSGGSYVLENLVVLDAFHGLQLGDRIHVTGARDPFCITFCQEGNGCILDPTIDPPAIECQIEGTAQRIADAKKNGQISTHMTCEAQKVALGPATGKNAHPTYARITSVLQDEAGIEYVNTGDTTPVDKLCLPPRNGGSEVSAKYEVIVPDPNPKLPKTTFSITTSRKDIKPDECTSGPLCSRYSSQLRVDRARIDDTSIAPGCMLTTEFQIIEGTLDGLKPGKCPDEATPALVFWAEAEWRNFDLGDCNPPKLRTPATP
jgi:hypothetical protein